MKKFLSLGFFTVTLAFANFGCSIKPPDDGSDLGPEISEADIENAKTNALAGYTMAQAYHTGDNGTVQVVDTVMGNSTVRDAQEFTVTSMQPDTAYVTETDTMTGAVVNGVVTSDDWIVAQSSFGNHILNFFAALPQPFSFLLSQNYLSVSHFLSSLRIEKTQALGENILFKKSKKRIQGPLQDQLGKNIAALIGKGLTQKKLAGDPTPSPSPPPAPTATPAPSATPDPNPSHYYGLQVLRHTIMTSNCSQIPNCQVSSTRLSYSEIRTVVADDQSLQQARFDWSLEISPEVPGLFVVLQQCFSTLVTQDSQQIPLNECVNVSNFAFGAGT